MGGGKSYALCQEAFDWLLDYPGILLPIFRNTHTAIVNTTRRTFIEQVLPPELKERTDLVKIVASGGKDYVEFLWNGSQLHFVGLDDPGRWFSSELGGAMFDEAHQIDEEDVITIIGRLRQRCRACVASGQPECPHMPRSICMAFNPSFPGHWLHQWCILGGQRTEYGYRKDELLVTDAEESIGDLEFFTARATDNPFLPGDYVKKNLGGMKPLQRRRYLLGEWLHISGTGFFDQDALSRLSENALEQELYLVGEPSGDPSGRDPEKQPTIRARTGGRLEVFRPPARWHVDESGEEQRAHHYVVGVDASSGASADWSAVQVIDADDWVQVAEWQGKMDPDKLAEVAFILAVLYNGAMLAPETTGGWGFAVTKSLQRLIRDWAGSEKARPKMYTRKVINRLSDAYTDFIGFDTNTKTRAHALALLEESIRDDSLQVFGARTLAELAAFASQVDAQGRFGKAQAQKGAHDDLVLALAIAVTVGDRARRQKRYDGPMTMRVA